MYNIPDRKNPEACKIVEFQIRKSVQSRACTRVRLFRCDMILPITLKRFYRDDFILGIYRTFGYNNNIINIIINIRPTTLKYYKFSYEPVRSRFRFSRRFCTDRKSSWFFFFFSIPPRALLSVMGITERRRFYIVPTVFGII